MMEYRWQYTTHASRDLTLLDRQTARIIAKKIRFYCTTPDPFAFAKPLSGTWKGLYRFRIGDYRVIFRKEPSGSVVILLILRVKHRREVYD